MYKNDEAYCGNEEKNRPCCGKKIPRPRRCAYMPCGNTFLPKSGCGINLFCSEECLEKSGLKEQIVAALRAVDNGESLSKLRAKCCKARYRATENGRLRHRNEEKARRARKREERERAKTMKEDGMCG